MNEVCYESRDVRVERFHSRGVRGRSWRARARFANRREKIAVGKIVSPPQTGAGQGRASTSCTDKDQEKDAACCV